MRNVEQDGKSELDVGRLISGRRNVIIVRYWVALLWLVSSAIWWGDRDWRLLFAIPWVVLLFFHITLAEVRCEHNILSYRRLGSWRTIDRREVVSSGLVWPPFIGYVRSSRFVDGPEPR
jgi:hypothetical protein